MKKTELLNLPIYDSPDVDVFDLQDWNTANQNIEQAYEEMHSFKEEMIKVDANAELVDARKGKENLGEKISEIDSQLEQKTDKNTTQNLQTQVNNLVLGAVGDGNNAEVIQARGEYGVLNDRLNTFENTKIEFDNLFVKGSLNNLINSTLMLNNSTTTYINNTLSVTNSTTDGFRGWVQNKKYRVVVRFLENDYYFIRGVSSGTIHYRWLEGVYKTKDEIFTFDVNMTQTFAEWIVMTFKTSSKSSISVDVSVYEITNINDDVLKKIIFKISDTISWDYVNLNENALHGITLMNNSVDTEKIISLNSNKISYWYNDKVLSVLGTSITATGSGGLYLSYLDNIFNFNSIKNCGVGGSRVSGGDESGNAFWTNNRVETLDINSNIVFIEGGANDANKGLTLLESDLRLDNYDTNTLCGAFNVLISKIYYKFLKVDGYYPSINYTGITQATTRIKDFMIVIINSPQTFGETQRWEDERKFVEYIEKIARMWGIPYCDIFSNMQLNDITYKIDNDGYDKVHFKDFHKKMAEVIKGKLISVEPI